MKYGNTQPHRTSSGDEYTNSFESGDSGEHELGGCTQSYFSSAVGHSAFNTNKFVYHIKPVFWTIKLYTNYPPFNGYGNFAGTNAYYASPPPIRFLSQPTERIVYVI